MRKKEIVIQAAHSWVEKLDISPPRPSKNYIPEWYKNLDPYVSKKHKDVLSRLPKYLDGGINMTAKMCVPILDSIMSGYIITMPCDIHFVDEELYGHRVIWEVDWPVVTTHSFKQTKGLNLFNLDSFEENAFKFELLWKIKPPKGYSLLYTHPFWNYNVPFFTSTAIVDSDNYNAKINLPFFIKKGFTGIIEKDTPIAQVIPIKREKWTSRQKPFVEDFFPNNIKLKLERSYKKRFWEKKEYE
jgi:hypothetical protein